MEVFPSIYIYGDSILKATVPDEALKYHFHIQQFLKRFEQLPVNLVNRARFGATVEKGEKILQADLEKALPCQVALLEFGGNDSNFNWPAIAQAPQQQHLPATPVVLFEQKLASLVQQLKSRGILPVLMNLPPIHAQRYFDFFSRTLDRQNLLSWLHGDVQHIYRYQEMYSTAVEKVARLEGVDYIDVRSRFLADEQFEQLISADGIHLSEAGYDLLFDALKAELCSWLAKLPPVAIA